MNPEPETEDDAAWQKQSYVALLSAADMPRCRQLVALILADVESPDGIRKPPSPADYAIFAGEMVALAVSTVPAAVIPAIVCGILAHARHVIGEVADMEDQLKEALGPK